MKGFRYEDLELVGYIPPEERPKSGWPCESCGVEFPSLRSLGVHSRKDRARCVASHADRFWRHVDKSAGPDGCWPWMGAKNDKGYGATNENQLPVLAHRFSLALALGRPLAKGELACHHCDNPPCVNPAHLFAGSYSDNWQDALAKGRKTRKLSPDLIAQVQRDHAAGVSRKALALRHGVAVATIHRYLHLEDAA